MSPDPSGPASRREAREQALELAYEAAVRKWTAQEILDSLLLEPDALTVTLLRAAEENREQAEALISSRLKGWTLERMALVDRLVMVLAVGELIVGKTPVGVVLSEAVELVSRYSTEESGRFVNGVLAAVARDLGRQT